MTGAATSPVDGDHPSLAGLLGRAAETVSEIGPEVVHYSRKLSDLNQRFRVGRFHLAVLGQFKRGKSTLLNALTGEPLLPVGVIPLTAAPTYLQYGEIERIVVTYQGARPAEEFTGSSSCERAAFLRRFVTEEGNPQNGRGVAGVQVDLPAAILAGGVVLIDTPGIGSTYRHNTTATLNFLAQCDAALFLVSADPPITEAELEFLRKVRERVSRLFFVMNKIDYLSDGELEEALTFCRRVLEEEAGCNGDFPIFCVSAREGQQARTAGDPRQWASSGMARLESFLVDFLATEKLNALKDAVSARAMDLVDAAVMDATIALRAFGLPQQELDEKIAVFAESLEQAERERSLVQDVLEGDKKRLQAFVEERARELHQEAEHFLNDLMNRGSPSHGDGRSARGEIQRAWAEAIPGFFEQQRELLNERVKARLLECLEPHEQRLGQLVEMLRRTAADLFRVPYRPLAREDALEIRKRPFWVLSTWNTDPLPILQSMDQRLEGLVRRNVENIRWSMLQNLNISLAGFARKTRERLDETVAATKGAMEAAHARRQTHGASVAAEVARLGSCIAALEASRADLAALRSGLAAATERADSTRFTAI